MTTREQLFKDNEQLAISLAYKYKTSSVELDDLKQEALLALWVATERFDSSRSSDFPMYAYFIIMSGLQAYLYDNTSIVTKSRRMGRIQYHQKQMHEIIKNSGILDDEDVCIDDVITVLYHPLEAKLTDSDADEIFKQKSYIRTLIESDEVFLSAVKKAQLTVNCTSAEEEDFSYEPEPTLAIDIDKALNTLGITESTIFRLKLQGYTYREIGAKLNISHQKAHSILKKAKLELITQYGTEGVDYNV